MVEPSMELDLQLCDPMKECADMQVHMQAPPAQGDEALLPGQMVGQLSLVQQTA